MHHSLLPIRERYRQWTDTVLAHWPMPILRQQRS